MDIYETLEELTRGQKEILKILFSLNEERNLKEIYDLTELGQLLGVSRRTISTWTKEGILPCTKVNNKIWVTNEQLKSFLESHHYKAF